MCGYKHVSNFVSDKRHTQLNAVYEQEGNAKAGREEKASNVIICTIHPISLFHLRMCLSLATDCHGHLWHDTEVKKQVHI